MTRGWKLLTPDNLREDSRKGDTGIDSLILIVRPGGQSYSGQIQAIHPHMVELKNGEIEFTLLFTQQRMMYQILDLPSPRVWKRGESQVPLKLD